ncbi:MAG: AmmeMemoRadiSam system protein A [Atribacterota bacterium]|jgi:AmmeMemoRadiSam system protein A|nr:AmmeMemoRadiSam system protein A [Atribacterota bacterium]MDY0382425.1 AmmeMemoRadiSam system protein A [Atribacterota bacterium]
MIQKSESIPVALARKSIAYYLQNRKKLPLPDDLPPELIEQQAGVFVSLKKGERLRGCIGTFLPNKDNIALEIIENAISSAIHDPRFSPVTLDEVGSLSISVDVLSAPEEIKNNSQLNPKKYGVIVSCGYKKGLLLPDLEGVDTIEQQIDIARQKAGIYADEDFKIERFEIKRYH